MSKSLFSEILFYYCIVNSRSYIALASLALFRMNFPLFDSFTSVFIWVPPTTIIILLKNECYISSEYCCELVLIIHYLFLNIIAAEISCFSSINWVSASFDRSTELWNAFLGKEIKTPLKTERSKVEVWNDQHRILLNDSTQRSAFS